MTGPGDRKPPHRKFTSKRPARTLQPRSADAAVQSVLALYGIANEIRAQRVHTEWADLVGPRIAARTRPHGVIGKTLFVEVASSAWVQELTTLRQQILTGLLERLGEPRLFDDLKFRLAGQSGDRPAPKPPRPRAGPAPRLEPPPATGIAREAIARDVEAVDDLELRELIARVRIGNDR